MPADRRTFLLGIGVAALGTENLLSEKPQLIQYVEGSSSPSGITLVNSVRSLADPFASWWDAGGRMFARSAGVQYAVLENEGKIDTVLRQLKSISEQTKQNLVFNVDLGSRYSAKAIAEVCNQEKIYFVTHGYHIIDVHPWDVNPYYVAHMAEHHELEGAKTGRALVMAIRRNGKIGALGGPTTDGPAQLRKAGLDQAMARSSCTLLDYRSADWEASAAFEIVRWWLAKYRGEIDGIWAANDRMALGAIEALRVQRIAGKIPVTGIDGYPLAISAIQKGELLATVPRDAFYEGGMGLSIAYSAKLGVINPVAEPNRHREFYLQLDLVTRENVEEYARYRASSEANVNWKDLWGRVNELAKPG
jgi:ribose transport system substrate-binding protein